MACPPSSGEDGIPIGAARYRIMTDIENFNKLGGVKKELSDAIIKKQMMDLILAPNCRSKYIDAITILWHNRKSDSECISGHRNEWP